MIKLKDFITKDNKKLSEKSLEIIRQRGIIIFFKIFFNATSRFIKKFFREYLPLKLMVIFSEEGKIIKNIQGNKMILNLNDRGISRELALYGCHEKNSTEQTKKLIISGMNILEVGGNIGYYLLIEAKLTGPKGKIYVFEPSPHNVELLEKNIKLNNYYNVEIFPYAVGDSNSWAKFYISKRSNLCGFNKTEDNENILDVRIIKLDDFLKDKKVDFIRMDIEGYEKEALMGLKETLNSARAPKYFFIEIHCLALNKKGSSAGEIINYLKNYGYFVKKAFYRGTLKKTAESTEELLNNPYLEKGYWETFFQKNESIGYNSNI